MSADFIKAQRKLHEDLRQALPPSQRSSETTLQTAFHFLQGCYSLYLMACVGYPDAMDHRHLLRHKTQQSPRLPHLLQFEDHVVLHRLQPENIPFQPLFHSD